MDAQETLARTLYAEAGTRPVRAIEALASLVMNRTRLGPPHARDVASVCRAPFSFPCWNPRHPSHLLVVNPPSTDPALAICRRIAARALSGALPDLTRGATHVHADETLPGWAVAQDPVAEFGGLVFYRLDPPRPVPPLQFATRPTLVAAA
jgi:spore germination cell wall hydrolase CwlJ-like protein